MHRKQVARELVKLAEKLVTGAWPKVDKNDRATWKASSNAINAEAISQAKVAIQKMQDGEPTFTIAFTTRGVRADGDAHHAEQVDTLFRQELRKRFEIGKARGKQYNLQAFSVGVGVGWWNVSTSSTLTSGYTVGRPTKDMANDPVSYRHVYKFKKDMKRYREERARRDKL